MASTFRKERWRLAGMVNVLLASCIALILLICLMVSISYSDYSLGTSTKILEGSCTTVRGANIALHLLLNIISSGIFASSNFFMQVLTSPSREDIDRAHAWLRSLDVGIPSVKNVASMSRFKQISWLVFLLSSLPIHLLFNSVVFETDFQGSDWQLTIGTEAFTQGAAFYSPGASLEASSLQKLAGTADIDQSCGYGRPSGAAVDAGGTSMPRVNISNIADASRNWKRLSPRECLQEYAVCRPRVEYGDVVVVVKTGTDDPTGWTRSQVFDFNTTRYLNGTSWLASIWDSKVPPDKSNPLWFSTKCSTHRQRLSAPSSSCLFNCLSLFASEFQDPSILEEDYRCRIPVDLQLPRAEEWVFAFWPRLSTAAAAAMGLDMAFNSLDVEYCLAEPRAQRCTVGISNVLLLIVIVCVIVKATQAAIIVWRLPNTPLVTPGDALESFISKPDPITAGMGSLDILDARRLEYGTRTLLADTPPDVTELSFRPRPRRWRRQPRRLISVIPRPAWSRTGVILGTGVAIAAIALAFVSTSDPLTDTFGESDESNAVNIVAIMPAYLLVLLMVNAPQIVVTLCYFTYNALFTRLQVEKEWNSYGLSYRPLRVSYPSGMQISSYRLQLPYSYSVPLLAISVLLHLLVSNSLFLLIIDGGYWSASPPESLSHQLGVSDEAYVQTGYSGRAILILFVVSTILAFLPLIFSLRKLNGDMVSGGYNSLVLSAACHITVPEGVQKAPVVTGDLKGSDLDFSTPVDNTVGVSMVLEEVSRGELRWGATRLSPLARQVSNGDNVMHLGFGTKSDNIRPPKDGELYL